MTRLRQTIARRLKDAQNTAAMLTTYNEVDMTEVMALRNQYKDEFEKKHGVRLGFMSFFTKACVHALKEVPEVNAEIDGTDIVYKNYVHMGIAAGTPQGLVVPVLRDADQKSFAEIEKEIGEKGRRARDGKLSMAEMQGGTFTISNGGVYGSLMSSPILNPPQSGILGMHKIQERPMVIGGEIVIRPMMYLALSYDHRIVDGKGAVTFLVRVKDALEDPRRLLMDLVRQRRDKSALRALRRAGFLARLSSRTADPMTPELTALTLAALLQVVQFVLMSVPANLELGPGKTASPRDRDRMGKLAGGAAQPKNRAPLPRAQQPFRGADPLRHRLHGDHRLGPVLRPSPPPAPGPISARASSTCPAYYFGWAPWRSLIWFVGFTATTLILLAALI
jgi:hypothetical protein